MFGVCPQGPPLPQFHQAFTCYTNPPPLHSYYFVPLKTHARKRFSEPNLPNKTSYPPQKDSNFHKRKEGQSFGNCDAHEIAGKWQCWTRRRCCAAAAPLQCGLIAEETWMLEPLEASRRNCSNAALVASLPPCSCGPMASLAFCPCLHCAKHCLLEVALPWQWSCLHSFVLLLQCCRRVARRSPHKLHCRSTSSALPTAPRTQGVL